MRVCSRRPSTAVHPVQDETVSSIVVLTPSWTDGTTESSGPHPPSWPSKYGTVKLTKLAKLGPRCLNSGPVEYCVVSWLALAGILADEKRPLGLNSSLSQGIKTSWPGLSEPREFYGTCLAIDKTVT